MYVCSIGSQLLTASIAHSLTLYTTSAGSYEMI